MLLWFRKSVERKQKPLGFHDQGMTCPDVACGKDSFWRCQNQDWEKLRWKNYNIFRGKGIGTEIWSYLLMGNRSRLLTIFLKFPEPILSSFIWTRLDLFIWKNFFKAQYRVDSVCPYTDGTDRIYRKNDGFLKYCEEKYRVKWQHVMRGPNQTIR